MSAVLASEWHRKNTKIFHSYSHLAIFLFPCSLSKNIVWMHREKSCFILWDFDASFAYRQKFNEIRLILSTYLKNQAQILFWKKPTISNWRNKQLTCFPFDKQYESRLFLLIHTFRRMNSFHIRTFLMHTFGHLQCSEKIQIDNTCSFFYWKRILKDQIFRTNRRRA